MRFFRRLVSFGLALATCLFTLVGVVEAQEVGKKWALVVGVSEYDNSQIDKLPASGFSAQIMARLLRERFNFDEVKLIEPQDADRAHIVAALEELANREYSSNDVVVFFYSGHGSQLKDNDGDESDGWDETLCPRDTQRMSSASFTSGPDPDLNQIRDDELNRLFQKIAGRTPNLTVVLDCCHSGTGTRSLSSPMRLQAPGAPGGSGADRTGLGDDRSAKTHGWTTLSASQEGQVATPVPGDKVTVLTKYLSESLERAKPTTTYRALIEDLRFRIRNANHTQVPTLEEQESHYVFAGSAPDQPVYYLVNRSSGVVHLEAGEAHGVSKGSIFKLYPPGTKWSAKTASNKPIGRFKVVDTSALKSRLTPVDGAPTRVPPASRALLEVRVAAEFLEPVFLDSELKKFGEALKSESHLELAKSEGTAKWRIGRSDDPGFYRVYSLNGEPFEAIKQRPKKELPLLFDALNKSVRFNHILALGETDGAQSDSPVGFEMKVLARRTESGPVREVQPGKDGAYHLRPGEELVLQALHDGEADIYLNWVLFNRKMTTNEARTENLGTFGVFPNDKDAVKMDESKTDELTFPIGTGELGDEVFVKLFGASESLKLGILKQVVRHRSGQRGTQSPSSELDHFLSAASDGRFRTRGDQPVSTKISSWRADTIRVLYDN